MLGSLSKISFTFCLSFAEALFRVSFESINSSITSLADRSRNSPEMLSIGADCPKRHPLFAHLQSA